MKFKKNFKNFIKQKKNKNEKMIHFRWTIMELIS